MASKGEPVRRRYDLSMSRRTRKPEQCILASAPDERDELQTNGNGAHRASLKELMKDGNGEAKTSGENDDRQADADADADAAAGEKLSDGVEEKKNLPLVVKQGDGMEGVKIGSMVSRYAKVLNHLIKIKRGSKNTNVVRLLMK